MKYLITILCLAASAALAQPEALPAISTSATNVAVSVTNDTGVLNGYVHALKIALTPTVATGTVTVATVGGTTIYSKATTGASALVYPRFATCDAAGSALTDYSKFAIANDKLKLTVTSATTSNVTVSVTPIIDRQP